MVGSLLKGFRNLLLAIVPISTVYKTPYSGGSL